MNGAKKDLTRSRPADVSPKEWVTQVRVGMQRHIVSFLLWAYLLLLAATLTMFFLQGFHAYGFDLPEKVLMWLGGATIGEIGGLLTLTVRASFHD